MAKVTYIELTPDNPIFHGRPQLSVLASRPSKKNSTKSMDGVIQQVKKEADQALSEALEDDDSVS